jgi:protein SCO1/2
MIVTRIWLEFESELDTFCNVITVCRKIQRRTSASEKDSTIVNMKLCSKISDHFQFRRLWVSLSTVAFALIVLQSAGAQTNEIRIDGERIVQKVGLDQHLDAQIPLDLAFRDESGQPVVLGQYFTDKPVILTLVYFRCPMLCTQVLNGLLEASQAISLTMGQDYHIISVSIDPRETSEMARAKKKRYVDTYYRPGADAGWHFLTGSQESIDQLTKTVGYRYAYDPKSDQYAHPSGIVVLTPEGRISRYFFGIDFVPDDLKSGLIDSSQKKISTPIEQFLLLCFHYDPATGTYGFLIANAIRIAGIATMVVLGLYLWSMFRRERRRSAAERIQSPTHQPAVAQSLPQHGSE